MRNATSISLFGVSSLVLTLVGGCGGGGDGASRDDATAGSSNNTAGSSNNTAGSSNNTAGSSAAGGADAGSGSGGMAACTPTPGSKKGDGANQVIDELDDTNTMFAPAGVGVGSWDFSKDASMGKITPEGTAKLAPVEGGHAGSALHVQGTGLTGWGAALGAFLNGTTSSFDASAYGGVAFWIKGTTNVQEGTDKLMVQARMPDVLPGAGTCCNDKVPGSECYSGHRAVVSISADWQEVKIPWSAFMGPTWGLGSTTPFNPNRVRDITLSFNHDAMVMDDGASFDVWVDGMRFMAKEEMGNVGGSSGGGSGGTGSGGTGGGGSGNEGGAE
jgi:hypothetical protein